MNTSEIKKMMISSLDGNADSVEVARKLEQEGVNYSFSPGFGDKVLDKLFTAGLGINREVEFGKYLNFAFYRIALTGVAAIVVLLISMFILEGSLSLNTFLGLSDNYDEGIVSLLTGI
jgi:hypothetical protein